MLNQILIAFVCIFAVIGLITVLYSIIDALIFTSSNKEEFEVVMFVKDREDDIEGAVRSAARSVQMASSSLKANGIIVVDCGSTDETLHILANLTQDIDGLSSCTKEEYLSYIEKL